MNPNFRNFAIWVIVALLLVALFNLFQPSSEQSGRWWNEAEVQAMHASRHTAVKTRPITPQGYSFHCGRERLKA